MSGRRPRHLSWSNVSLWSRIVLSVSMAALLIDDLQVFTASGREAALIGAFCFSYLAVVLIVWLPTWSGAITALVVMICGFVTILAPVLFVAAAAGYALAVIGERRQSVLLGFGLAGAVFGGMVADRFPRSLWWAAPVVFLAATGVGVLVALVRDGLSRLAARTETLPVDEEEARLRERARIATDLHDGLGQSLALISLAAGAAQDSQSVQDLQRALSSTAKIAQDAREQMHELTNALAPLWRLDCLDDEGIPIPSRVLASIQERLKSVDRPLVVRNADALDQLPPGARDLYCRVLWEGITNALQHSRQGTIVIEVTKRDRGIELVIASPIARTEDKPTNAATGRGLIVLARLADERGARLSAGPSNGRWQLEVGLPNPHAEGRPRPADGIRQSLGNRS